AEGGWLVSRHLRQRKLNSPIHPRQHHRNPRLASINHHKPTIRRPIASLAFPRAHLFSPNDPFPLNKQHPETSPRCPSRRPPMTRTFPAARPPHLSRAPAATPGRRPCKRTPNRGHKRRQQRTHTTARQRQARLGLVPAAPKDAISL
ncbi:hypothetical protein TPAR_05561, partial [Tolypocladium paradoxum]